MLFIFYVTVSTFLYILGFDCFSVNNKGELLYKNKINLHFDDSENENITVDGSVMSKHKSLLQIIQNPSEPPNLKSNIFDNMLFNEMLSIKQQLYEKNESHISPFYITFNNSIATPTLELRQRWPIEVPLSASDVKRQNERIYNRSQSFTTYDDSNLSVLKIDENSNDVKKSNNHSKSKVVGVRSFSSESAQFDENVHNHQHTKRQCTCMKTNFRTTCTYRCSGALESNKATCTQNEKLVTMRPECTRNTIPLTYYPYYVYSPLFLGITTDSSAVYYHPDVLNELKLPKHKYSKNKKPTINNLYLDNYENKEAYENEYLDYIVEEKPKKRKHPKHKCDKVKKIYYIDYKEKNTAEDAELPNKISEAYFQVLDTNKFVENVVEDLKAYYSDAVAKECYCSISPFKLGTKNLLICILILIIFIMHTS